MSNIYPYTDYHELNLDWFIKRFKQLEEEWQTEKSVFDDKIAEALEIVRSAEAILTPVTVQAERAEQAAQNAQNNSVAAASSAAAALEDANRASTYASGAILARNTAQNAAASAEESKQSATAAKNAAQNSATTATNAATSATSAADSAMNSEGEAKAAAAEAQRIADSIPEDYSDLVEEVGRKTEKVRIDFDGTNFTVAGEIINYQQLYDFHITSPDFAFVVYGDRAYLLSYVQDGVGMKEMRFESTIAVTNTDNLSNVKTSGIYVISSDGINITSVRITDINSENKGYKVTEINDSNKNNVELYTSVKAVADIVLPLKEDVNNIGFQISDDSYVIKLKNGYYVDDSTGHIAGGAPTYSVTQFIALYKYEKIHIYAPRSSRYCAWYSDNTDTSFISSFTVYAGDNDYVIPTEAKYCVLSDGTQYMLQYKVYGVKKVDDRTIHIHGTRFTNEANTPEIYKNLNNLPLNEVVTYSYYINGIVTNIPNINNFTGIVVTYSSVAGNANEKEFLMQYAYVTKTNTKRIFYRIKYDTWSDWEEVVTKSDLADTITPSISMFRKIGVIGDSFASGCVYNRVDGSGGYDNYPLSWIQNIARRNGITAQNFSHAGISARAWQTDSNCLPKLNSTEAQDLYIIALGINDVYQIAINESAYYQNSDNAIINKTDTMCGNLSKIVSAIKEKNPQALIVFIKINPKIDPRENFAYYISRINQSIEYTASYFECPVLDQSTNAYLSSDGYINGFVQGHPTAVGYSGMSVAIQEMIEKILPDEYFNNYPY